MHFESERVIFLRKTKKNEAGAIFPLAHRSRRQVQQFGMKIEATLGAFIVVVLHSTDFVHGIDLEADI